MESSSSINQSKTRTIPRILTLNATWKTSLVCDFMELYRYLVYDFLIDYCQKLRSKDFITKTETVGRKKQGKREYLTDQVTRRFTRKLEKFFESMVEIPRIKQGKQQTFETLINEEALLLANYLRCETNFWVPRCPSFTGI